MESTITEILNQAAQYYSNKLSVHGNTPKGVDWNSESGQILRFHQLTRIVDSSETFSVCDLGCGYGALYPYLASRYPSFEYIGVDVSESMISSAKQCYGSQSNTHFLVGSAPDRISDYVTASGIFNVNFDRAASEWEEYFVSVLDTMNAAAKLGFSFNCLTSYSDPDKTVSRLFYPNPCQVFDLCKKRFSRYVTLIHDYELFEFTILVRKAPGGFGK